MPTEEAYIQTSRPAMTTARRLRITADNPPKVQIRDATDTAWVDTAGGAGGVTFADPSAQVGPVMIPGAAATAMRSDAAPAINLSANYNWTARHTWAVATYPAIRIGENVAPSMGWSGGIELIGAGAVGIIIDADTSSDFVMLAHGEDENESPYIRGISSNGTRSAPAATANGRSLIYLVGGGYSGTIWNPFAAAITAVATQQWTGTAQGTKWQFMATQSGTTIAEVVAELTGEGQLILDWTGITAGIMLGSIPNQFQIYHAGANLGRTPHQFQFDGRVGIGVTPSATTPFYVTSLTGINIIAQFDVHAGTTGPATGYIVTRNAATVSTTNKVGLEFQSRNDAGGFVSYGTILTESTSTSSSVWAGTIIFQTAQAGVVATRMTIGEGVNVGAATGAPFGRVYTVGTGSNPGFRADVTDITTASYAQVALWANDPQVILISHASARTLMMYGFTVGGWGELRVANGLTGASAGLLIGTGTTAAPIVFGTNSLARATISAQGSFGFNATPNDSYLMEIAYGSNERGINVQGPWNPTGAATIYGLRSDPEYFGTGATTAFVNYFRFRMNSSGQTFTAVTPLIVASPIFTAGAATTLNQIWIQGSVVTGVTTGYGLYISGTHTHAVWVDAGTVRLDEAVGIGIAPTTNVQLYVSKTYSTATAQYGVFNTTTYDTADNTNFKYGIHSRVVMSHTTGTMLLSAAVHSLAHGSGNGGTTTNMQNFRADAVVDTGHTNTIRYGYVVLDATGAGSIGTQYGVYIANLTKGTTADIGLYIVDADTYAIHVDAGLSRFDDPIGVGVVPDTTVGGWFLNTTTASIHEVSDAGTTTAPVALQIRHTTSGTAAAGFGVAQGFYSESDNNTMRIMGQFIASWVVATDASRTSRLRFYVYDATTSREALRIESSGTAPMIGFLSAAAAVRQTFGAATAAATYGANEQAMLQKAYDAFRTFGLAT